MNDLAATRRDLIRGCFLGGALGDALGAPVEFLSLEEIRDRFGPDGVTEMEPAYGRCGAITDDTQMTLFTAEGLIRAHNEFRRKGISHNAREVLKAYFRWLHTQGVPFREMPGVYTYREPSGWLVKQKVLHQRRAPGRTCLSALEGLCERPHEEPENDSKGCGGVMRVAPVGFVSKRPFEFGAEIARFTHRHPTGFIAAGAFAAFVQHLFQTRDLEKSLAEVQATLLLFDNWEYQSNVRETLLVLREAWALTGEGPGTPERVESLGEGWVAEEALAIAVYCARVAEDFRSGVRLAVNHSGDSDSTGSLTGQLLGLLWGESALPSEWLDALEGRQVIERLADDFAAQFFDWESGRQVPDYEAYPA